MRKRPVLLVLDPADFTSDDATSNLDDSSQTNTFCQTQTLNKGLTKNIKKPSAAIHHRDIQTSAISGESQPEHQETVPIVFPVCL